MCTHAIFAFAKLEGNMIVTYERNDHDLWYGFVNLKQRAPSLKTMLAVGGWNHPSGLFSDMVASRESRAEFIESTIYLLRQRNFDGLDLDWEYPGSDSQRDKDNFSALVQELHEAFEQESRRQSSTRLLLAVAVAASVDKAMVGYDVPVLNKYTDFISVMTYDYHGSWEDRTGLATPLESNTDNLSLKRTMRYYLEQGASPENLVVGLALFGRTWTLAGPNTGLRAPAIGGGPKGVYTKTEGVLAYYEICPLLSTYTKVMDPIGLTNYAFKGNHWVTFDDQKTLKIKLDWIQEMGFGGVVVWNYDLDDFSGQLGCGQGKFPLLSFISKHVKASGSPSDDVGPPSRPAQPENVIPSVVDNPDTDGVLGWPGMTQIEFKCPYAYGYFPSATSCHDFYACDLWKPYFRSCYDAIFNPITQLCENPKYTDFICPW